MTLERTRVCRGEAIERLEARSMMLYAAVLVILAFMLSSPVYLAALAASIWIVLLVTGLAEKCKIYLVAGFVGAAGVALLNPLVSRVGMTVLWQGPVLPVVGRFNVTAEAIAFGLGMALRLACVVSAFALYATAVSPDAALKILSRISFGSALILALAVRLFPAMTVDAARIMDAQRSRGLRLDTGNLGRRVLARGPIVDCLLLRSLERAVQVAESMESRGYGRARRSAVPLEPWRPRDWLVAATTGGALALGVALTLAGPGRFEYYPLLSSPVHRADLAGVPALVGLTTFPAMLAWGWTRSHWLRSRI